ncbi:CAP domain-containing protein [Desulfosporosinus sp. BG]|uniref:CAP domain-containing protein n=1 Tax=Desulfosporosinus sp. BG TaxID=1633135 RepID=UPI00083A527B|nr:CAP domain-containing protein [Desulfosporosinus sp. BG]ODA39526.1 Transporter [Desulfosporosinus sp. BG]
MKKTSKLKYVIGIQIGILLTAIALPVQAAINIGAPRTLTGSVVSLRSYTPVTTQQTPNPTPTPASAPTATPVPAQGSHPTVTSTLTSTYVQNPTPSSTQSLKIGQSNSGNVVSLKNILNQPTSIPIIVTPATPTTVTSPTTTPTSPTTTTTTPTPTASPTTAAPTTPTLPVIPSVTSITADEQLMVDMINQERLAAGLSPVKLDLRLASVGRAKANDLKANNYFDHTSPTYGSPWAMMQQVGLTVGWAGENISANKSVASSMAALMLSPGHRANILDPRFTHVGVGIAYGSAYGDLYVQEFLQE